MSKRLKRGRGLPRANTRFRHALIPVWLVVVVLLTAAYGNSKTVTPSDKSPHPTASQSTSSTGQATTQSPVGLQLNQYLRFGSLTTKDGLSNNMVWGIAQDHRGFMWFTTADGLSRYDGADFKVYYHDPRDPNSLSQSFRFILC